MIKNLSRSTRFGLVAAILLFAMQTSSVLAGPKVGVPSIGFFMEMPEDWFDIGGESVREQLLLDGLKPEEKYRDAQRRGFTTFAKFSKYPKSFGLRNPTLAVDVLLYEDESERDPVVLADRYLRKLDNMIRKGDGARAKKTKAAETTEVAGQPSAVAQLQVRAKEEKGGKSRDIEATFWFIPRADKYFVIYALTPVGEPQATRDEIDFALNSVRLE
jgi:hypothetical protein